VRGGEQLALVEERRVREVVVVEDVEQADLVDLDVMGVAGGVEAGAGHGMRAHARDERRQRLGRVLLAR
jgi:hypothetical protein